MPSGGGQGVGHVAAQGGRVAHLRPADQIAGLGEGQGCCFTSGDTA
jgi:hypothetical protein